jgi:hypothetical protein
MASCGAPASLTHIRTVAGSDHEFYTKNTGKRARFKGESRGGQGSSQRLEIMKPTQAVS